jgi:hypothetical protein
MQHNGAFLYESNLFILSVQYKFHYKNHDIRKKIYNYDKATIMKHLQLYHDIISVQYPKKIRVLM